MAEHFRLAAAQAELILTGVVTEIVSIGVVRAKSYIGHQQSDWKPLSGATLDGFRHSSGLYIRGKRDLGYPDDPLLRDGTMRDSIEGDVKGLVGEIGSHEKTALWQELGTEGAEYPIKARPFLAKALQSEIPEIEMLCEQAAVKLLVPGRL